MPPHEKNRFHFRVGHKKIEYGIYLLNFSKEKNFLFPKEVNYEIYNENLQNANENSSSFSLDISSIKKEYLDNNFKKIEEVYKIEKRKINEKDAKHLIFGENNLNIEEELKKIENVTYIIEDVLTKFQTYKIQFSDETSSLKLFNENFFNRIKEYENTSNKLINQLTAKISKEDPRIPEINKKLDYIKTEFNNFKNDLVNFMDKVKGIKKLWNNLLNLSKKEDTFFFDYSSPIIENEKKDDFNFKDFNYKSDFLSLPILTLDTNNLVKCCYKELNYSLGNICPSLYKNKSITFNILSFLGKNADLQMNIENKKIIYIEGTDNNNLTLVKKEENIINHEDNNNLVNFQIFDNIIKILILIPQLKDKSKSQKIKIECDLHFIGNKINNNSTIHCIFTANLIPLSIILSCEQYELAYDKDEDIYILNTHKLNPKEIINFKLKYFNIDLQPKFKIYLESFISKDKNQETENESEKPKLNINPKKNNFSLQIPDHNYLGKIKRLKCLITIFLIDKLSIKIIIDANIVPFDFSIACYDYYTQKYIFENEESKIFINQDILPMELKLFLKIFIPEKLKENNRKYYRCESKINNIREYITILDESKVDTIFDFCEEIILPLKLKSNIINKGGKLLINKIIYNLSIKGRTKKLEISLVVPSKNKINNLNYYIKKDGQWIQEDEHSIGDNLFLRQKISLISYDIPEIYDSELISEYISLKGEVKNEVTEKEAQYYIPFIKTYRNSEKKHEFYYPAYNFINNSFENLIKKYKENDSYVVINKIKEVSQQEEKVANSNSKWNKNNISRKAEKEILNQYSFFSIANLLLENENLFNIIKTKFNLQGYFEDIKSRINMIDSLYSEFKERIEYIQENAIKTTEKYSDLSLEEIKKVQNQIKESYYNEKNAKNAQCNMDYNLKNLIEKIKYSKTVEFIKIPKKTSEEAYIINEDSSNFPNKRDEQQQIQINIIKQNIVEEAEDIEVEIPDFDYSLQDKSIDSFINFMEKGIQASRVLPLFVKNALKSKNKEKEKIAINKLQLLVNVYNSIKSKTYSIFSDYINNYIKAFNSMASKLADAGLKMTNIIPEFQIENNYRQDFFKFPDINIELDNYLEKEWETKRDFDLEFEENKEQKYNNEIDINKNVNFKRAEVIKKEDKELEEGDFLSLTNLSSEDKPDFSQSEMEFQYQDGNVIENAQNENKKPTISKTQLFKIIISKFSNIEDRDEVQEEDDFILDDDESLDDKEEKKENIIDSKKDRFIKNELISNEDFEQKIDGYSEKNAVDIFLTNILNYENLEKEKKNLPELNLGSNFTLYEPKFLESIKNIDEGYFIGKLINISRNLGSKLYNNATSINIPYLNICANIIIDCTFFINYENKFYIMFLICALTCALNALEIPYSVLLISDENFKVIIKQYNEIHSDKIIQRIFDCIFITRFYTSLANGMKFSIDRLHYQPKEERPYRAFFVFTNGLDDQIYLFNEWKEKIFRSSANHEKDKFGFTFIKGDELTGANLNKVIQVWNNFEKYNKDKVKICQILSENPINDIDYTKISHDFAEMFSDTLEFPNMEINDNISNFNKKFEPIFDLKIQLNNINNYEESIKSVQFNQGIYVAKSDVLSKAIPLFIPLNDQYYKNKLNKIASVKVAQNISGNLKTFISKFPENKNKLSPNLIETLFKPNFATKKVLSTQGSEFDITALILNLINPMPNPKIYLERKIMDKRKYGITIVIDSSYSCFNIFNFNHSFLTIRALLSSLLVYELPILDVIISGEKDPYILVSNTITTQALGKKSTLIESLLAILQNPPFKSNLCSAIRAAYDLKRLRQEDFPSYLFVLTDGLYQKSEIANIVNIVNCCVQAGMNTYGIGVGIYPKLIDHLFPQVIYCKPNDIIKGIVSFLGDNISKSENEIVPHEIDDYNSNELNSLKRELIKKVYSPSFEDLKDELKRIPIGIEAMRFFYNPEKVNSSEVKGYKNPIGKDTEIYKKGTLEGHKILITMLWTWDMSTKENTRVDPMFLLEKPKDDEFCLKDALDYYGLDVKIVLNYREAIEEITKEGKIKKSEKSSELESCCEYYAVFVICGPPYKVFPEQRNNEDPELIGKFTDALIQFWKNQGSIVFLAEGTPLCFQVNTFLENCDFPGLGKVNFRIGGDFIGEKIIKGDNSGNLNSNGLFNRKLRFSSVTGTDQPPIQRSSISHNLFEMYEGSTISYVTPKDNFDYNNKNMEKITDLEYIKPFKAFAKGSNGGIISLFYNDDSNKFGDIVIDTGFTKCFLNMKKENDSFRYFQNIIGWISRPEIHTILDKKSVKLWRPKQVKLTENVISTYKFLSMSTKFQNEKQIPKMPTIIAMDCSESIEEIEDLYFSTIKDLVEKYKDGPTVYYQWGSNYYKKNYMDIKEWIKKKKCDDGTDSIYIAEAAINAGPEFWGHLIIVTDGKVKKEEITKCDDYIKKNNIKFKYVSTYVIGPDGDLSVGAPFTRGCENQTIYILAYRKHEVKMKLSEKALKSFEKIDQIENYEEFRESYGKLVNSILAKMLGKDADEALKEKLNKLKKKVETSPILQKKKPLNKSLKFNGINYMIWLMEMLAIILALIVFLHFKLMMSKNVPNFLF